jgi:hypothetical protein
MIFAQARMLCEFFGHSSLDGPIADNVPSIYDAVSSPLDVGMKRYEFHNMQLGSAALQDPF